MLFVVLWRQITTFDVFFILEIKSIQANVKDSPLRISCIWFSPRKRLLSWSSLTFGKYFCSARACWANCFAFVSLVMSRNSPAAAKRAQSTASCNKSVREIRMKASDYIIAAAACFALNYLRSNAILACVGGMIGTSFHRRTIKLFKTAKLLALKLYATVKRWETSASRERNWSFTGEIADKRLERRLRSGRYSETSWWSFFEMQHDLNEEMPALIGMLCTFPDSWFYRFNSWKVAVGSYEHPDQFLLFNWSQSKILTICDINQLHQRKVCINKTPWQFNKPTLACTHVACICLFELNTKRRPTANSYSINLFC